jgi:hypothetical protein
LGPLPSLRLVRSSFTLPSLRLVRSSFTLPSLRLVRSMGLVLAIWVASIGCTSKRAMRNPLPPAGDFLDDGSGWLAQSSVKINLAPKQEESSMERNHVESEPSGIEVDAPWQSARPRDAETTPENPLKYQLPTDEASLDPTYKSVAAWGHTVRGRFVWRGRAPRFAANNRAQEPVGFPPCSDNSAAGTALAGIVIELRKVAFISSQLPRSISRANETSVTLRPCGWTPSLTVLERASTLRIAADIEPTKATIKATDGSAVTRDIAAGDAILMKLGSGTTTISSSNKRPAFVHSVDTPLYAITDDEGLFQIDNVIAGKYDLLVWRAPIVRQDASGITWGEPIQTVQQISLPLPKGAKLTVSLAAP